MCVCRGAEWGKGRGGGRGLEGDGGTCGGGHLFTVRDHADQARTLTLILALILAL